VPPPPLRMLVAPSVHGDVNDDDCDLKHVCRWRGEPSTVDDAVRWYTLYTRKLHLYDLLWICCGLYSKSTASPRQI